MEILGQPWWIQAIGATISTTGLYFWVTGVWQRVQQYKPLYDAIKESHKLP